MFKELFAKFSKVFRQDRIIILVLLLVLGFILYKYSGVKGFSLDGLADGTAVGDNKQPTVKETSAQNYVAPSAQMPMGGSSGGAYTPKSVSDPNDLLPHDMNSEWASLNPTANQNGVVMPDLLQAGYHIGLDTIGQTLRNANQQLRSDPIIPKKDVGPWNASTIEPDIGRTPLEIGGSR